MAKIERCGVSISFEDLKAEFRAMDDEIKDKGEEIVQLRQALIEAQKKYALKEKEATQNIGEMEELHENLAELDKRFERSETLNVQLREELETVKMELQSKNIELSKNIREAERSLRASQDECERLRKEFNKFKTEANVKYELMRTSLKTSIENTMVSVNGCLEQRRRRSSKFRRKGKCYKMLQAVSGELEMILATFNKDGERASGCYEPK